MAAAAHYWRRHRWTALRSLLLVALLHRLQCLAFLAASSPVWLLAAFLLGVVLVHSEPNVPLAAASQDEDRHLYKKIRHLSSAGSSAENDSADDGSSATSSSEDHLGGGEKEEEVVVEAAVAWTADDEHSIRSIGSLELERDARLEKLMSRRSIHRNLIDLDVHIPAVLTKNPFDMHHHHHHCDDTGSAPSFLLGHHSNPFDFPEMQMRRHESFTAGAAARPSSRFRPYFVADVPEGGGGDATGSDNSNSSSTTSSSAASDHHLQAAQQQAAAVKVVEDEAPAAALPPEAAATSPRKWGGNGMVAAVDVELISDSSDDDMSLPGDGAAAGSLSKPPDEDEEDSFEVESITQQVAAAGNPRASAVEMSSSVPSPSPAPAGLRRHATISSKDWVAPTTLASVEENERSERDQLSEMREHHILGPVPVVIDDSPATGAGDGAAGAVVAAAAAAKPPPAAAAPPPAAPSPAPPAALAPAPSAKQSSKSKGTSKKAVFGFFRK